MDDSKRIFTRMDIKQIRTFLLNGVDDLEMDVRSFEQQIKEADEPLHKRLEALFPDEQELDDFYSSITQALVIREQLYMEIGMKAGARLIFQLLSE